MHPLTEGLLGLTPIVIIVVAAVWVLRITLSGVKGEVPWHVSAVICWPITAFLSGFLVELPLSGLALLIMFCMTWATLTLLMERFICFIYSWYLYLRPYL